MIERLKDKWGITSSWDVLAIMVVFAISGSSILFVKPLWYSLFNITEATPTWLRVLVWIAMVFPTYQAFLLIYGFIFGQFKFFWAKEKAMAYGLARIFGFRKKRTTAKDEN